MSRQPERPAQQGKGPQRTADLVVRVVQRADSLASAKAEAQRRYIAVQIVGRRMDRPVMDHETISISQHIAYLVAKHGSLRKAGRVIGLTGQYLYRLQQGEKTNPSEAVLRKLGLRRVVSYVRRTSTTARGK